MRQKTGTCSPAVEPHELVKRQEEGLARTSVHRHPVRIVSHRQATHFQLPGCRRFALYGGLSRVACSWRIKDE
jgi:hypothetical protein